MSGGSSAAGTVVCLVEDPTAAEAIANAEVSRFRVVTVADEAELRRRLPETTRSRDTSAFAIASAAVGSSTRQTTVPTAELPPDTLLNPLPEIRTSSL